MECVWWVCGGVAVGAVFKTGGMGGVCDEWCVGRRCGGCVRGGVVRRGARCRCGRTGLRNWWVVRLVGVVMVLMVMVSDGWCGADDAVAVGAVFETGGVRVMMVVMVSGGGILG